jgi:hypothetical protein
MNQNFSEEDFLIIKIKASPNFTDRVMANIEKEESGEVLHLSKGVKFLNVIVMIFICILLGLTLGGNKNFFITKNETKNEIEMVKQFRDTFHLYAYRNNILDDFITSYNK